MKAVGTNKTQKWGTEGSDPLGEYPNVFEGVIFGFRKHF